MAFTLPDLPYAENALEPAIDAQTMNIHRTKHHAAYIAKLNDALAGHADLADKSIDELCKGVADLPEAIRGAVRIGSGRSAWVRTAATPGTATATEVSMERISACAW